ncbi:MAG: hypothetical protein AAFQ75_13155, partial [Pseudomonadota bacterium]
WHIAAAGAGAGAGAGDAAGAGGDLAAATLEGAVARWPDPGELEAGFAGGAAIPAYEGAFSLALAPLPESREIVLSVQVCGETLCLAPEAARWRLV